MHTQIAPATLLCLSMFATACGGGVAVSVDSDELIVNLRETEVRTICHEIAAHWRTQFTPDQEHDLACAVVSIDEDPAICSEVYHECKRLDQVDPWFGRWDCGLDTYDYEDCSATAGELASCSDEVLAAFRAVQETADCQTNPAQDVMKYSLSAQCTAVMNSSSCGRVMMGL
jgi:hypothetical protein